MNILSSIDYIYGHRLHLLKPLREHELSRGDNKVFQSQIISRFSVNSDVCEELLFSFIANANEQFKKMSPITISNSKTITETDTDTDTETRKLSR